jgi:hypothetical protein
MKIVPFSIKSYLVALSLIALLGSLPFMETYQSRLGKCFNQVRYLPIRVRVPFEDVQVLQKRAPYELVQFIRSATYEDAILLISDDARDRESASPIWMAYYLYPRIIVRPNAVEENPDLPVDFMVYTQFFHPGLPDSLAKNPYGLAALSSRAQEYVRRSRGQ